MTTTIEQSAAQQVGSNLDTQASTEVAPFQVTFSQVARVYSGLPGCMCGCRGKYHANPANPALASQGDKFNGAMVAKVVGLINRSIAGPKAASTLEWDSAGEWAAVTVFSGRTYVAYFAKPLPAPSHPDGSVHSI